MDGTPFGRYRLIAQLGRGRQADVWQAERFQPTPGRVALKILNDPDRDPRRVAQLRREDFMAEFLQPLAHSDRMRSRLHGDAGWRQIGEPLLNGLGRGPEATSANDVFTLVERAVAAPDIF